MNSMAYALMTYGLTALISLAVVGIVVLVNSLMGGNSSSGDDREGDQ